MLDPVIAMALLTLAVFPYTLVTRIRAVRAGKLSADYFLLFKGEKVPEKVVQTSRHISNLFEAPVLFYTAGLIILILKLEDPTFLLLGWTYFALRCVHSFVHLSYNKVLHRLVPFVASNIVLLIIWLRLAILT